MTQKPSRPRVSSSFTIIPLLVIVAFFLWLVSSIYVGIFVAIILYFLWAMSRRLSALEAKVAELSGNQNVVNPIEPISPAVPETEVVEQQAEEKKDSEETSMPPSNSTG